MSKYAPLTEFLLHQLGGELEMTFTEIEQVLDFKLPPSARVHRAWWGSDYSSSRHAKSWLSAGWKTQQVNQQKELLNFVRIPRPAFSFTVGQQYSREDIASIIGYPEEKRKGGTWTTGLTEFEGSFFNFVNVGLSGRTGHDYLNRWDGKNLVASGKANSKISHPQVIKLVSGIQSVHIFWRTKERGLFSYAGDGRAVDIIGDQPFRIVWSFNLKDVEFNWKKGRFRKRGQRRGPKPTLGSRTSLFKNESNLLYVAKLSGMIPKKPKDFYIKVGVTHSLPQRFSALNCNFPCDSDVEWQPYGVKQYDSGGSAYAKESELLELLKFNNWQDCGEFGVLSEEEFKSFIKQSKVKFDLFE